MLHDFLPEQSHKQTGQPAGAAPLGWSHAWLIVVLQRLGQLVMKLEDHWATRESS